MMHVLLVFAPFDDLLAAEGHAAAYPGYRNNRTAGTNSSGKMVLTNFIESNVRRNIVNVAIDPAYG